MRYLTMILGDALTLITGGAEPAAKPIRFFDYNGTLLYSYTLEELQNLTELPPPPRMMV